MNYSWVKAVGTRTKGPEEEEKTHVVSSGGFHLPPFLSIQIIANTFGLNLRKPICVRWEHIVVIAF